MAYFSLMNIWSIWCTIVLAGLLCTNTGAADDVKYGVGSWPEKMGSQRACVQVDQKSDAVLAHVEWRRSDPAPRDRNIVIMNRATGKQVANIARVNVNREFGDIVFQPDAPGNYDIYYMLYSTPESSKDQAWLDKNVSNEKWKSLPQAKLMELQARTEFDRFDPMQVIATKAEVDNLLKSNPFKSYLLFPEDRKYPVKMADYLPQRWIQNGASSQFHGEAARNEFYVFQIGVYAARSPISDVEVGCSGIRSDSGRTISESEFRCFNLGGSDWLGRTFFKRVPIEYGKVRSLWFGVMIPKDADPGDYSGALIIKPKGAQETRVDLTIKVIDQVLEDHGDSELWRMSRLRWLNSTIGLDDTVVAPYTPLEVVGDGIKCLGRSIHFNRIGLPDSIKSNGNEILASPVEFTVTTGRGTLKWSSASNPNPPKVSASEVVREIGNWSGPLSFKCVSKTDFDGYTNFRLILTAKNDADIKDISLKIPIKKEIATYMMGFGREGGYRPSEWKWTWDINRANNQIWIGDVDAGLQCKLKGAKDTWDGSDLKAAGIPESWGNNGKGGCTVSEDGDAYVINAYSSDRTLKKGDSLEFRLGLLITPVKPLDPAHWSQRYNPVLSPVEEDAAIGANIQNVHHATPINPYINYPFLTADKLSEYVKQAHDKNIKVKIYYTVRELSNHVAEIWALRSLGDEIFLNGSGGGYPWLQEHLANNYSPAWLQPLSDTETDAAIATTGLSRWHNYYLEGLSWLVKNTQIDGLYLDGIGYDREIMKRVRRVLDSNRAGCLIDFHSGNEFPYNDWRISPACKYMEHFPYVNSLWFGEMYDYENKPPDYWLVEISGIPYGLFGDMLQGGGNPWRGMLYGMTGRYKYGAEPQHLWKLWDEFGIQDAKMIGYWSKDCPVKTGNKDVLATVYSKPGKALVSIASWANEPVKCKLEIDWKALGIDIRKADLKAPAIGKLQNAEDFQWSSEIPVEPKKGWLLLLSEK